MGCGSSNATNPASISQIKPNAVASSTEAPQSTKVKANQNIVSHNLSQGLVVQDLDEETTTPKPTIKQSTVKKQTATAFEGQADTIDSSASRYKKLQLIDKGAYGKVFKGIDVVTNQTVAIKYIEVSGTFEAARREITSLKKEISLLKKLDHPYIVKYLDFDISDDKAGVDIILEYISNGSVRMALNKEKKFDEKKTAEYMKQVLLGLEYLHSNKIIHRDLKSANLLIDITGKVKLTDFGTAKQQLQQPLLRDEDNDKNIALTNKSLKGTPNWMAPEVIDRTGHSESADIWSIGCVTIEMLTGKPPYPNLNAKEVFIQIASGTLPAFPIAISEEASEFLKQCLQRDPRHRSTASQLLLTPFIKRQKIPAGGTSGGTGTALMNQLRTTSSLSSEEELLKQIDDIQRLNGQTVITGQRETASRKTTNLSSNGKLVGPQRLTFEEYQNTQVQNFKDKTRQSNRSNSKGDVFDAEKDILQLARGVRDQQGGGGVVSRGQFVQYSSPPPLSQPMKSEEITTVFLPKQAVKENNNYNNIPRSEKKNNDNTATSSQMSAKVHFNLPAESEKKGHQNNDDESSSSGGQVEVEDLTYTNQLKVVPTQPNPYWKHENKVISSNLNPDRMAYAAKKQTSQAHVSDLERAALLDQRFVGMVEKRTIIENKSQEIQSEAAQRDRIQVDQQRAAFEQDKERRKKAWEEELQRELEFQRNNPPDYLKY